MSGLVLGVSRWSGLKIATAADSRGEAVEGGRGLLGLHRVFRSLVLQILLTYTPRVFPDLRPQGRERTCEVIGPFVSAILFNMRGSCEAGIPSDLLANGVGAAIAGFPVPIKPCFRRNAAAGVALGFVLTTL